MTRRPALPALGLALLAVATALGTMAAIAQPMQQAFEQGTATGKSGNGAARARIDSGTAQRTVPGYTSSAPQASYFGSAGISAQAAAAASACSASNPATGTDAQTCQAVNFSQTNPTSRQSVAITPANPLLSRARAITADPQAIAGNLAGTSSGCNVQTTTTPDRYDTAVCHQYRAIDTLSCDKVLIVSAVETIGCTEGQRVLRVGSDPCPRCPDSLVFDFSCKGSGYEMHVYTIDKATGATYMEFGRQDVEGGLGAEIPKTPGPSQEAGFFCYATYFSQTCSGGNCSIGTWFDNPCQGTSQANLSTFPIPRTVTFTDAWDNQCAALEARAR